ncbi:hypothetical protein NCPPB1935_07390 [Xanthomonas campestris pv. nigromaculans]|nr:hypothetical protein CFBP2044_30690 [Xanthomonas hortorum pv. cynarae]CAD0345276.1 hypothetical protein CFBP2044_30690 [Xanthomonas hortorum pv. cynarae]CAH2707582.1 hypothetical protein NCPPB1935_07390 [Xanthomonas campestris pv. nigromaculans]
MMPALFPHLSLCQYYFPQAIVSRLIAFYKNHMTLKMKKAA